MQTMRVLSLALLAVGAAATRRSATAAASQAAAQAWLRSHGPAPQKDELADLRAENPEAYALVKALLTKRSLGLLDPMHPTASFAPSSKAAAEPHMSSVDYAASVGVTDKASAAATDSSDVELPPPVHHAHKDWLNWRPAESAAGDDAEVQQVLGAVAQLKPGSAVAAPEQPASAAQQPLVAEPAAQPVAVPAIPAAEQPVSVPAIPAAVQPVSVPAIAPEQQQPAAAVPAHPAAKTEAHENSYLKGLDFDNKQPTEEGAPVGKQGLVGVKQTVAQGSSNHNYLKDFSWSDDAGSAFRAAAEEHPLPPAHIITQDEALPATRVLTPFGRMPEARAATDAGTTGPPRKQNALVSWLGSSWGPVQAQPDARKSAAALQSSTNTRGAGRYSGYLKGLVGQ